MTPRAPRRRRDGFILNVQFTPDAVTLTGEGVNFAEVGPVLREWIAASCGHSCGPIRQLTAQLREATHDLSTALETVPAVHPTPERESSFMAAADILADLDAAVTNARTVMASAAVLIRGISDRINAAVQVAMANGATAAQLAPITDEVAALRASEDDLSAAMAENTPASEG